MTSVGQRSSGTLGDVLTEHQRTRFVGRQAEIDLFCAALDDATDPSFSVLYLQGPGGIGKTSLLRVFGEVSAQAGATVVRLDGHDVEPSALSVLAALEPVLVVPSGDEPICLAQGTGRLVLLLDAFELPSAIGAGALDASPTSSRFGCSASRSASGPTSSAACHAGALESRGEPQGRPS